MPRTRLSPWQIGFEKEGDSMKYVEVKHETNSQAGNSFQVYRVPFPEDVEGINIKTIRVTSIQPISFIAGLLESATGDYMYQSLEEMQTHYDNVDIPFKPTEKALFVKIHNKGSVATKFKIDIRGIEVK